jgi:hypothetical protein
MAVIKGPDFETFRPIVHPLVAGPPAPPELYDTDVSPKEVYGSALTEVFRVKIGEDGEKEASAKKAWGDFVKGIGAATTLSGVSVNVEAKTFLGAIGWESEEVCESMLRGHE